MLARSAAGVGHLTLNRPRAINALDDEMITQIRAALDAWRDDADVQSVLLDGAGERGLCAGGDVRALYDQVRAGQLDLVAGFFQNEYTMNAQIAEYRHPIVALADGVTMGGGIGLAGHAAVRVVTERSKLAMPETRIGFTPDVGGTWLLGRAPGRVGEFLATTCATMDAADAVYAGFADHLVPSAHLGDLRDALQTRADPGGPSELVLLFDETPETSNLERWRGWIDECFAADTVPEIIDRLHAAGDPEATATAERMTDLAPTGMAVTLESVRRARAASGLREVLVQEYGLVMWFATTQPDLVEGIRAQLVDKDRTPRWNPATPAEVPAATIADAFAFVPERPLWQD
ncbi:3-hydroxyisobutyryl-CoA hydrolase [Microbacterium mangrovi]|uniref:3-hydroxyisobutyryl-CoA hydrolase n=1 Tax=Microbacterium mangrovi TaxID=1348253 RepID=A0A0B2A8B9_9MICO|nr:3-hydroxyisobutyryl-CoA hydrolase [Microbacterium mangrovi]